MTIVVEVDTAEGFLPMDGSGEFPIDPGDFDIKEGQLIGFFFFYCEFDVLVRRVHVSYDIYARPSSELWLERRFMILILSLGWGIALDI